MQRPDIVLLMTDQQRHDWIGPTSGGHFETPTVDRLAADGVLFEQAYSSSTTCVPSRVSLLTGLHHHRTPREGTTLALPSGFWTVARELRAAGYETAMIGRMHFVPIHADHGFETMRMCENVNAGSGYGPEDVDDYQRWMESQGRPDWRVLHPGPDGTPAPFLAGYPRTFPDDVDHHPTGWIEREALAFLERRDRSRPMFLVVSFPHPHAPYDPPEPYASMYPASESVLPTDGAEVNDVLFGSFREAYERMGAQMCTTPAHRELLGRVLASVRGLVRQIDDSLGRVVDALDLDSSLVFFTSDHGDYGGHRGMFSKVPWIPFDDLFRVPLVVAGGAVAGAPRRSPALVQSGSFAATCLDYAGISVPDGILDFPSLRPLLDDGDDAVPPRPVVGALSVGYPTIRSGDRKLILSWSQPGERLLFDLAEDPGETVSVADDPAGADEVEEMFEILKEVALRPVPEELAAGEPIGTAVVP